MKHLKLFETSAQYESWKSSDDFVLPNVSCTKDGILYYNPSVMSDEPTSSYIAVDLGLPSGRLWADRNVGAASPEELGLAFQWGHTTGYTAEQLNNIFMKNTYDGYFDIADDGKTFNKYAQGKLTVLEASDDAATVNMGSEWRMPTKDEMQELIDNTTITYIDIDGKEYTQQEIDKYPRPIGHNKCKCIKLTGLNGNSIVLYHSNVYGASPNRIASSELSSRLSSYPYDLQFYYDSDDGGGVYLYDSYPREYYFSVRGVK